METTRDRFGYSARLRHSAAAAVVLFAIFGCAYGRLVPLPPGQDNIETFVEKRYETVDTSYSGIMEKPGTLRFDIKGDGVTLTGSGWQPLGSKDAVFEIVRNMQTTYRKYKGFVGAFGPRLYEIMDKENRTIGYIYSPLDAITVRPDGPDVQVDAITELDVRNTVYPPTRPGAKRGMGHR